ncbi:alginate lyase family protein [Gaiella occulta]|uniref:alginate lyase family protein n=1 Tax=Gaiella occulta TaxID=1002870 RepID=UPI0011C05C3F|nr:alginate lyase family protein [Gaiella occulta]
MRIRANVRTKPWSKLAWQQTLKNADSALSASPHPADPRRDYRDRGDPSCPDGAVGWYCGLYLPGLEDGRHARNLAMAYTVTGNRAYALKSKEFLLAWARTYSPLPATSMIGHYIAEVGGITLKSFQAYALVQDVFSPAERQVFTRWAAAFVDRGKRQADAARDEPWVPQAPWGNSATWARSMAVLAAAVVGGRTLRQTLDWNWAHTTTRGKDYGWKALIEGVMYPGGKMVEEDVRQSVFYALFTLQPLMLIADVAQHVGYRHNLWTFRPVPTKGILAAIAYYAPYLQGRVSGYPAYTEPTGRTPADIAAANRSVLENAANDVPGSALLRRIVAYGGPGVRGTNDDPYIVGYNAVTAGIGDALARASR